MVYGDTVSIKVLNQSMIGLFLVTSYLQSRSYETELEAAHGFYPQCPSFCNFLPTIKFQLVKNPKTEINS